MRKYNPLPTQGYLRQCLRYNRRTGALVWKRRPREHFISQHACDNWNTKYAGKLTFCAEQLYGHLRADIGGKTYCAARIIWKLVTGAEPPTFVDHKDRNPRNNRWHNLRLADHSQNTMNSSLRNDNKSGYRGVSMRENGTWRAQVNINKILVRLGTFSDKADAIKARQAAEVIYGEFLP